MKRSEINKELRWACELLKKHHVTLPSFAYWSMDEWKKNADRIGKIRKVMMGWDISDYGLNRFHEIGCVLFTVRNGNRETGDVPYCEKYLLFHEGQRLPIHHHRDKTEDIINRAGGDMWVRLYGKKDDGTTEGTTDEDADLTVLIDGFEHTFHAGEEIIIKPGNSIRLTPFINHTFGVVSGSGELICGEVSKVNDDVNDNFFTEKVPRFADIEEDEAPLYPLCNEYDKWFS